MTENNETPFNTEEQNLPAVVEAPQQAVTVQELITQELSSFALDKAKIASLKKKYAGLTISGIDDKAGYKKVTDALKEIRPLRTGVGKDKDRIKARYLEVTRAVDAKNRELTEAIQAVEKPLLEEKERIDKLVEEEKQKEERERKQRETDRVHELLNLGCAFDGTYYSIGENTSIAGADLGTISAELWETFTTKVREESDRLKLEEAEKERQKKEQEEAEERQREQLRQDQEKLEAEKKQFQEMRRKGRETVLKASGYSLDGEFWRKSLPAPQGTEMRAATSMRDEFVSTAEDADFYFQIDAREAELKETNQKLVDEVADKAKQEEKTKQKNLRIQQLEAVGLMYNYSAQRWEIKSASGDALISLTDVETLDADSWAAALSRLAEEVEELQNKERLRLQKEIDDKVAADKEAAEEKRKRALAELPEAEQIDAYLKAVDSMEAPEIKGVLKHHFYTFLNDLHVRVAEMFEVTKRVKNAAGTEAEGGKE